MLALTLVFSVLFVLFSLILGSLVGWVSREYFAQNKPYTYHPEMFDEDGNVIPDELIAFTFDSSHFIEEEETED